MYKMLVGFSISILMLFSMIGSALASNQIATNNDLHFDGLNVVRNITELKELVTELALEQQKVRAFSVDFSVYENLYLHPLYDTGMVDARTARLLELVNLVIDASIIQERARGNYTDEFVNIFSLIAEPGGFGTHKFTVGLTRAEYLDFVDFIVDFTGIEEDMLNIIITGPPTRFPTDDVELFTNVSRVAA